MHKVGGVTGGTSFDYLQTKFASLTFQATLETYFMQSVSPRGEIFLFSCKKYFVFENYAIRIFALGKPSLSTKNILFYKYLQH